MTNKEIMDIAMQQSAYDTNAKVSDFLQDTNVFVKSGVGPLARKYYKEPIACNFVSYGSNVVASVKDEFKEIVETYLSKFEFYHCFETPNMHWLDERMKEKGYRVCFMAEYFLPDHLPHPAALPLSPFRPRSHLELFWAGCGTSRRHSRH